MPRPYIRHSVVADPDADEASALALALQENIRLTTRLAQQAEELTAMRNQLDMLTASSTTAADATQLLTTRTMNASAAAEADLEQARSELAQVRDQAHRAIASTRADAQRRIDSVTEELRLSRLEVEAVRATVGEAISEHQILYVRKAEQAKYALREALKFFEN